MVEAPPAYNFESREQELLGQISELRKVMVLAQFFVQHFGCSPSVLYLNPATLPTTHGTSQTSDAASKYSQLREAEVMIFALVPRSRHG